jgi:hypothetical protein
LESAARAISDGAIRSGLIFDTSKLNRDRIQVVWLSPNNWSDGSRYGNVDFSFNWNNLISGKKYYWVESIAYSVKAARILVTDNNYNGKLLPYDPAAGDGPWWFDKAGNTHYWNGNHCLEIMYEGDLPIESADKISFVDHHPRFCNIAGSRCPNCGLTRDKANGILLSLAVARRFDVSKLKWVSSGIPNDELNNAFYRVKRDLTKDSKSVEFDKDVSFDESISLSIGRAILIAYSFGDHDEIKALMKLMPSLEKVTTNCAKVIASMFSLSNWKDMHDPDWDI